MFPDEELLTEARFFEKNINKCEEYEDAYVFRNTRKKAGPYNPVVFKKDGPLGYDAIPYDMYTKTKLIAVYDIPKER